MTKSSNRVQSGRKLYYALRAAEPEALKGVNREEFARILKEYGEGVMNKLVRDGWAELGTLGHLFVTATKVGKRRIVDYGSMRKEYLETGKWRIHYFNDGVVYSIKFRCSTGYRNARVRYVSSRFLRVRLTDKIKEGEIPPIHITRCQAYSGKYGFY